MAASHSAGRKAQDFTGHDVVAVQQDNPVNRADELHRARAPAHAPCNWKFIERGLHDGRQEFGGTNARPRQLAEEEFALGVVDSRECIDGDAAGFGESFGCARRLTRSVEGRGNRWPAPLEALFGLPIEEFLHEHGEAARREVGKRCAVRKSRGIEARDDGIAKCLGECDKAFRRHFLDADLDKEVVPVHELPEGTVPLSPRARATVPGGFFRRTVASCLSSGKPWASRLACQLAATARASARTRRM